MRFRNRFFAHSVKHIFGNCHFAHLANIDFGKVEFVYMVFREQFVYTVMLNM